MSQRWDPEGTRHGQTEWRAENRMDLAAGPPEPPVPPRYRSSAYWMWVAFRRNPVGFFSGLVLLGLIGFIFGVLVGWAASVL